MQVKNEKYVEFLKGGLLETIPREKFEELYHNVSHKQLVQAQCLFTIIWCTGRRPAEVLNLTAGDFEKKGAILKISFRTLKRGIGGVHFLPLRDTYISQIWGYVKDKLPGFYVFWAFRSSSKKNYSMVKVRKKMPDGSFQWVEKRYNRVYVDVSDKLLHWFKKWFKLPPYYFRHNRFTRLSEEGASVEEIRQAKGAKGYDSVLRYMHVSSKGAKKIGKLSIK